MSVRRKSTLKKWIKDYIVPIIGLLLILILIFSIFSWEDDISNQVDLENKIGLNILMDSPNSEWFILYPGGFKKQIEWNTSLYKWEEIKVKNWRIALSLNWIWDFNLDKIWEFKYLENWDFSLNSSNLWLNSVAELNINMKFASVQVGSNTNISFSQNEMWSTVYLINWFATVSNLVWESTVLASGQKITITNLDASKKDLDLSLQKSNIDDYYKQSDWFILNNWSSYLKSENTEEETSTGSVKETTLSSSKLLNFSNLIDESNVSSDTITISWNYSDEEITNITLNWVDAIVNTNLKTFKFEKVSVKNRENDLVFKVYDDANDLLSKFLYTVFYEWAVAVNKSKFNVQTFDVDGSQFIFTTIKDWVAKNLNGKTTYTTYWDFLTLYWKVIAKWVANVSVNGYTLKSYNGSTWRYHASSINNNLSTWTNVYEVKYYDKEGKVLYTNHFTIIKKKVKVEKKETISDEAEIN